MPIHRIESKIHCIKSKIPAHMLVTQASLVVFDGPMQTDVSTKRPTVGVDRKETFIIPRGPAERLN